jgi:hypothetical protein
VDPDLSSEVCRTKALDCMIQAEILDDPTDRAAMLQDAEWWNRLAEHRERFAG